MLGAVWEPLEETVDEALIKAVQQAVEQDDWASTRRAIRTWLTRHRAAVNPLLEQTVFAWIAERFGGADATSLLEAFRQPE